MKQSEKGKISVWHNCSQLMPTRKEKPVTVRHHCSKEREYFSHRGLFGPLYVQQKKKDHKAALIDTFRLAMTMCNMKGVAHSDKPTQN